MALKFSPPESLLSLRELLNAGQTLILRADPKDPIFNELNRMSCDQFRSLLALPAANDGKFATNDSIQFTVVRTAFGNLPVIALQGTTGAGAGHGLGKTLLKLKAQHLAFSEKNLGDALTEVKSAIQQSASSSQISGMTVWNAI